MVLGGKIDRFLEKIKFWVSESMAKKWAKVYKCDQ
jgi:hypothetical protein